MNPPKPPPQTLQPDDERKIQVFLERASSIVLDQPVLDLPRWRRLVTLAEQLGLSEAELRSTVNDLRHRGIISEIDLSPPKPPPLPSRSGSPTPTADAQAGPEQDFSLTPPSPPTPAAPERDAPPNGKTTGANGTPPPPPPPTIAEGVPELSHAERLRRYLERAEAIIAEQRGFGGRTHTLLAATADELGLSDEEAAEALQSLGRQPDHPTPPPPPDQQNVRHADRGGQQPGDKAPGERLKDSRRWRVEGAPPPEPPPPTRKPEAIFREYLSASLAQITDGTVPVLLEKKFLNHGISVLGLARTFARHLVSEEAAEKGLRLESKRAGSQLTAATTDEAPAEAGFCDANVKLFLERSVPILAQHRGINAKSRVLLNALAGELGLTEEQVDRAIAATQFRSTTAREDADALQQERLVGFRELVQGALISLPRKLLTFDIQENLCRHGEERHGLQGELATSVIRDVCAALAIRQISEAQACEHVARLVDAKLAETPRLPYDVCTRIESEGKQWGLSGDQVGAIIKEQTRLHDKRRRAERNFTHGSLFAASLAALLVAGFFGWIAFDGDAPDVSLIDAPPESLGAPAPMVVDEAQVDTAWWGEELEVAVGTARRELRAQRPLFIEIESKHPEKRRAAYGKLIADLFAPGHDQSQRELLIRVISLGYARDPDAAAARTLLDGLLARLPRSERELRADETFFPLVFQSAQAVAALVSAAANDRQSDAATEFGRAIGRTVDSGLDHAALKQLAYEGVAERLYRLLAASAKSDPARVASTHALLAEQAAKYLDATRLEKLNTDFLVVVLGGDRPAWRQYEPLIRNSVASKNPLHTIRMLDVYEQTDDPDLQEFLGRAFIERLGTTPASSEVAAIADEVRKSLGVVPEDIDNKRLTRFLAGANALLAEPSADAGDGPAILAEIVDLVYHSTLGCAVAQGSAGDATFDRIAAQDVAELLTREAAEAPVGDPPRSLEPTTLRMLNERLTMLGNPRISPVTRFGFVETIAGLTDRIDDLAPDQAAALAAYLLGKKRVEEHRAILPHIAALGTWKQVRLAVADQLAEEPSQREQVQEIVSQLLGREYEIGSGDAGREALRVELLQDVLEDVKREDVGDPNEYRIYNDAAQSLYDLYAAQAMLLRAAEWPESPITPSSVVRAMIDSRVKQLLESPLVPELKRQVEQVDVDLRAVDYLAHNDLQRLVLLDRAWLRLLVVEFTRKQAARQAEADAILQQLAARDRDATHVLSQLRDGHKSILQLWLLLNDAE